MQFGKQRLETLRKRYLSGPGKRQGNLAIPGEHTLNCSRGIGKSAGDAWDLAIPGERNIWN